MRTPATVGPAEESRVELEVGGVGLPSTEFVGTLIDDPRAVHRQEVNAVPVGRMLETVGDGREVAASPAHVVDVGLGCDVVGLGLHHVVRKMTSCRHRRK